MQAFDLQAAGKRYSQSEGPVRRLTVKGKKLHLLVPDVVREDVAVRSAAEKLTHNSEKEDYIQELKTLATDLQFDPVIHLMHLSGIEAEIQTIPSDELIMNVCDGSDIDGVPGPSVAAYLEAQNYPNVVGCDSLFINNTLTKNGMKELFRQNLVSTPPGFALTKDSDLAKLIDDWGMVYPLFIKVSDSYGSVGIDDSSVCHDFEQVQTKCAELFKEFENLTVEEYIDGQEYSVLVSGNCRDESQNVIVYPPAERAFNKDLPRFKRFISYVRNWDEAQYAHVYEAVEDPNDFAALQDLSRRAYAAVSGNAYGRVDIRKRDVSGKFYVLEVNASCGLGKGSSSEFILKLAGQTTQDFFQILLSSALKPLTEAPSMQGSFGNITAEPDSAVALESEQKDTVSPLQQPVLPAEVEQKIAKLIRNPSLAVVPNPVVHVVCAAVLTDPEAYIPDPEGKLAVSYGKDVEYVSELESIFRSLYYDPIVHVYNVDDVQETLKTLSKEEDLIFNACLGNDGLQVAKWIEEIGFQHTIGLNARFFTESHDRQLMREGLSKSRLSVAAAVVTRQGQDLEELATALTQKNISVPVYLKPSIRKPALHDSGQKISTEEELKSTIASLPAGEDWLIEQFVEGSQYMVLVAGDARDPCADLIVFPPVRVQHGGTSREKDSPNGILGVVRKLSMISIGKNAKSPNSAERLVSHDSYIAMKHPDDLMLQMDLQDLARRAFVAVHGSCYGLVSIIDREDGGGLTVVGVSGDVRFGDQKSGKIMKLAGQNTETLFSWLLKRPVKA
ncbi:D-alanine---D-alanine ligase [Powellomyces hirtus]|uniref:D-alanine---D-alanine ligase n=1 Tax=Powellomyces hirtus TaxID=109895 RepID=A0A507E4Q2_9FUNG|nr:D-alanine---D-alanine ligase [Powellomyces hirtus]